MTEKTTVVNAERFSQGFAYPDYLAQIKVNQDRFARYYDTASDAVTDEDTSFFKKAVESGCSRVLVLGEDWCPDVYRGMPVIGRIAEVSGMDMRVFPRDEHLDIADEFLNRGEYRSIPVFVFYNADQEYRVPLYRAACVGHQGDGRAKPGHRHGDGRQGRGRSPRGPQGPDQRQVPRLAEGRRCLT